MRGAAAPMSDPATTTRPGVGFTPDCEYLGDHPDIEPLRDRDRARLTSGLVATVVFLTAIAPLATDMYVPAFPRVAGELSATATQVQLTLTTFFVGMALGQLIGGPVSDQRGRRRPLIAAILVMTVASVLCALTPTIGIMMVARFVQGFSGGWAMVIGRAVIVDLASGARLVRVLNVIAGVGGIAPIVGPLLGAVILQLSGWRISFWAVAGLGLVMTLCVLLAVPESLPAARRHGGGLRTFAAAGREVLGRRRYVGYLLVSGSAMAALFAYVATSAFVLQSMNGLSPIAYSVDFAANAGGMTIAALVAARLAGRVATRTVILVGQVAALTAGVAMLAGAVWLGTPLLLALVCFFVLMTAQGLIGPNGGALASAEVPEHPGTGSAVLGFVQWVAAGITAPIAGLGGQDTAVPMALLITAGAAASMVGLLVLARPAAGRRRPAPHQSPTAD
jgi:MFS transporter, DHA1 family, multidrug resistance protein